MASLFNIPTVPETYSIAARPLTPDEVALVPFSIIHEATCYFDSPACGGGPRQWPSYEAFLGFKIADAALRYQLDPQQLKDVVAEVYRREAYTIEQDRKDRAKVA